MRLDQLRYKLQARRNQLGLNQRQAAARMRANVTAFNQLELGNRANPTIETLNDWVRSLGGRLIIDVEFPEQVQAARPRGAAVCRLESPDSATCACPGWKQCYLNEAEAEAS